MPDSDNHVVHQAGQRCDAQAAVQRIGELEDELENIALALILTERLERSPGTTAPADEVIRELGFDDILDGLPGDLPG